MVRVFGYTPVPADWDGDWSHAETEEEYLDRVWDGYDLDLLPKPGALDLQEAMTDYTPWVCDHHRWECDGYKLRCALVCVCE